MISNYIYIYIYGIYNIPIGTPTALYNLPETINKIN